VEKKRGFGKIILFFSSFDFFDSFGFFDYLVWRMNYNRKRLKRNFF